MPRRNKIIVDVSHETELNKYYFELTEDDKAYLIKLFPDKCFYFKL